MTALNRPAACWAAVAAWAGVIFLFSSQSELPGPSGHGIDKVEHAATYAFLAFLLARAWFPLLRRRPRAVRWALVILAVVAYGISDEIHQAFVPRRECDPFDVLADFAGALLCAIVFGSRLTGMPWPARLGLR